MRILIGSEKSWNKTLADSLKRKLPEHEFILVDSKDGISFSRLEELAPDKLFFPHWSHIIPSSVYEQFECIVFHMTDLPFGRGGSPLQNLVSRKIFDTKVSALQVVKEVDAGPVHLKKPFNLYGRAEEVFIRLNRLIEEMIVEIIEENPQPQEQEGEVVIFKRRTPEKSDISDIKEPETLLNHINMLDAEGYPKAFVENENYRFEFSRAALNSDESILADVRIIKK